MGDSDCGSLHCVDLILHLRDLILRVFGDRQMRDLSDVLILIVLILIQLKMI